MKNTDVFNQFDMVVSYTQKMINDQLVHLTRIGTINPSLTLVQTVENRNYKYLMLQPEDPIPEESPYISCTYVPQIHISQSGTDVTLVLNFVDGSAYFWDGFGRLAQLVEYDMAGWKYGIDIDLNLAEIAKEDLAKNKKVPDLIKNQLEHFTENMFFIDHLFMDFESADLLKFNPTHTDTKASGQIGQDLLKSFMQFYLENLIKDGNPFILGYSVSTTDQSQPKSDQKVPDTLRPVGTTFTLFEDPENPDLSNLNFVLATKGGKGAITGSPGIFDTNWFSPKSKTQAKMITSSHDLIEAFILKPFYNTLRKGVQDQISKHLKITENNSYEAGKKLAREGIDYTISDVSSGDDQYVNVYHVAYNNSPTEAELHFSGHMYFKKNVSKSEGCNAEASAEAKIEWAATITITTTKNAQGEPSLQITKNTRIINHSHHHSTNGCADTIAWIGKALKGIFQAYTHMLDLGFLANALSGVLNLNVPGIGNVGQVFGNFKNALGTYIILPAGDIFLFKNPSLDEFFNFYMDLTLPAKNTSNNN